MSDISEEGFWYKARYTPLRDVLRGKLTARLDLHRELDRTSLPAPVKESILRVVNATRLWRLERVGVLHELIAHFVDGISSGVSAEVLLERFGDETQTAALIRRAKRRNRPMAWHALRYAAWSTIGLLVFYGSYAIYFLSGHPSPRVNYVSKINRAIESAPLEERAWPLYRRALIGLKDSTQINPSIELANWPSDMLPKFAREHQTELAWIRQGSAKPQLGWLIGRNGSVNDPELWPNQNQQPEEFPSIGGQSLNSAELPSILALRKLSTLLRADGMLALESGDGKRLMQDMDSNLGLSQQLAQNWPLLINLVSLSISDAAMDQIEQALRRQPGLISIQDLNSLTHRLSAPRVAADLITLQMERERVEDSLQRAFTDDGKGNGRLTEEGVVFLLGVPGIPMEWWKKAASPAMGLIVASRQKLQREYTRSLDLAETNMKVQLREASWKDPGMIRLISTFPVWVAMPSYFRTQVAAERNLGRRDGIVTAIALELYRREHGNYPEHLDALVPKFLSQVPADRITGAPIRYRLVEGKALVYSVGANRKDDGRNYSVTPERAANWDCGAEKLRDGDWVLYPTLKMP